MREMGPTPGKNPKMVGERPAENDSRFPCWMNSPPVKRLRSMKGPLVLFRIPTLGCSFHVAGNSIGKLMPVSQSISVEKSSPKIRVKVFVVSLGSTNVSTLRRFDRLSVTRKLLRRFQRPIRRGVLRLKLVVRVSKKRESSWGMPSMGGRAIVPAGAFSLRFTTNENDGDQVMLEPMLIGTGVRLRFGSVCVICSSLICWVRLPPMLMVPQSCTFEKLMVLRNCPTCKKGSTEFSRMTRVLVAKSTLALSRVRWSNCCW